MNRFSVKALLIGFLAVTSFFLSVSPALANCDGWAQEGSSHRNAGNGCSYTCRNGSWAGPNQCDGQGNGQFQGEAARTAEERERQARAVAERNTEARAQVERQGTAETARIAASTSEQRAVEATRQQAMVENQRQQEVSIAARFGASAQEIAAINARAREAATFVSQAQGTDRGANLVGSDSQNAADIAARGYEATSSLATGVTVVNSSSQASVGGGASGGGDVASAALYTNPADKCDILAPTNGDVVPGGRCCRGGNVECASGTCSAGSIGQYGVCSGGTSGANATGPDTALPVTSVSFRDTTGRATVLPVVATENGCATGSRSCAYQGRFVCVNATTYAGATGCGMWNRDFSAQANRGSAETVLQTPSSCTGNTRGCMYGGGWVCVDKNAYPETDASADSSRGCAAWQRDYTRPQNGGSMTHKKNENGSCVLCAAGDSADVCKYSSFNQCSNALALGNAAASRPLYRLLSGQGTSCIRCVTAEDVERYDCRYTESNCGGASSATASVDIGKTCNASPGMKCSCPTVDRPIDRGAVCPTAQEVTAQRSLPSCSASSDPLRVPGSGANRTPCLFNGVRFYKCTIGTAANNCGTSSVTNNRLAPTDGPTVGDDQLATTPQAVNATTPSTVSYTNTSGVVVTASVLTSSSACTGAMRGCQYNGGWVCVSKSEYPVLNDSSNGCSAWDRSRVNNPVPQSEQVTTRRLNNEQLTRATAFCSDKGDNQLVGRIDGIESGLKCCNRSTIASTANCESPRTDGPDTISCVSSTWTELNENQECCGSLERATYPNNKTYCVNRSSISTINVQQGQRNPVCNSEAGCQCANLSSNPAIYSSPQSLTVRFGESCPAVAGTPIYEDCGSDTTVPFGSRNSSGCVTNTLGYRGKCTANYHVSNNKCVANNLAIAATDAGNTALSEVCRLSGNRLPFCNTSNTRNNVSGAEATQTEASLQPFCADKADNVADNTNTASNGRFRYKCCGGVSVIETTTCSGVSGIPSQTQLPTLSQRTVANNFCAGGSVENNQPVTIGRSTNTDFKCCNGSAILRTETCTSASASNAATPVTVNGLNEEQVNVCERAACGNPDCVRDTPAEIQTYNTCIRSSAVLAQTPAPLREENGCMARACGYTRCTITNEGQRQVYVACMGGDSYESRITSCNNQLCGSPYCNNADSAARSRIHTCINTGTLPPATQSVNIETRTEFCSTRGNNVPITGSTQQKCCNGRAVNNDVQCAVVIETDGEVSSDTLGVSTLDIAQNNTACGGSLQTPCDISAQGQSWRTCDRGYSVNFNVQGSVCQLDVRAIANDRDTCGGNLEPSCAVVSDNNRTVQTCDSGSLYNASINLCVPALYSGVPACSAGTLYDSQSLTNLTACYSGSGTNRSLKYYCPAGTECAKPGQAIGVNGCGLMSSRPNATSCGISSTGQELFRCEHGPYRTDPVSLQRVCPSLAPNGNLVYAPSSNAEASATEAPTVVVSRDAGFCRSRGNRLYTYNSYTYNCCNTLEIPAGQTCSSPEVDEPISSCSGTSCVQPAVVPDSLLVDENQRWGCLATEARGLSQATLFCRACDGANQSSCSAFSGVEIFNNAAAISAKYPTVIPQYTQ